MLLKSFFSKLNILHPCSLRKLNQATLLQDVSKNQTNNASLRSEVMKLRREVRTKNNFIKLLCSPEIGATLGPDYIQHQPDALEGGGGRLLEADTPPGANDVGRGSVRMLGMGDGAGDESGEGKIQVIGDFMLNNMTLRELNKIHNVKVDFIYGCMTYDLVNHVQRLKQNLHKLIIHVGSNDAADNNDINRYLQNITKYMKQHHPTTRLTFSSVIVRKDRPILVERIRRMNEKLEKHCEAEGVGYIDNSNITDTSLDVSKVHLNKKGSSLLANNILAHILHK